jgi:hypothetical protein
MEKAGTNPQQLSPFLMQVMGKSKRIVGNLTKDPNWVTFVIQQGGNNHFTPLHTTQTHDMLMEYNYVY